MALWAKKQLLTNFLEGKEKKAQECFWLRCLVHDHPDRWERREGRVGKGVHEPDGKQNPPFLLPRISPWSRSGPEVKTFLGLPERYRMVDGPDWARARAKLPMFKSRSAPSKLCEPGKDQIPYTRISSLEIVVVMAPDASYCHWCFLVPCSATHSAS